MSIAQLDGFFQGVFGDGDRSTYPRLKLIGPNLFLGGAWRISVIEQEIPYSKYDNPGGDWHPWWGLNPSKSNIIITSDIIILYTLNPK